MSRDFLNIRKFNILKISYEIFHQIYLAILYFFSQEQSRFSFWKRFNVLIHEFDYPEFF